MQQRFMILVTLLVLSTLVFEGCTESTSERNKFIGTWTTQGKTNPLDGSNYTDTVIFYQNGTCMGTIMGIRNLPGTWNLQDGKLRINTIYPGMYQYVFSDNNTVLTLTPTNGQEVEVLTKQG